MLKALITDVDGTLSGPRRELCLEAVQVIRLLVHSGVPVVLASGNTACFMDALCKITGTDGTFIGENGGVFRVKYSGSLLIRGNSDLTRGTLSRIIHELRKAGDELELFSHNYRFSDVAFARTVPVEKIKKIIFPDPVNVVDTGYAIHIHSTGISKGAALCEIAGMMDLETSEFLAVGDGLNDIEMFSSAGMGAAVENAHESLKKIAGYVAKDKYGEGFVECVRLFFPHLFASTRSTTI